MAKLTLLFIFISFLQISANSYSQTGKLDLKLKNATILEVFEHIEDMSTYRFFYDNEQIDLTKKVSINTENEELSDILKELLDNTDLTWDVKDRLILVQSKNTKAISETVSQQQKSISGTVTDEQGEPLPGVTVIIKGAANGTVTNTEGIYSLLNIHADASLVFSFVGMKTKEIPVAGKTMINIVLVQETIGIEEVVAIGYGTMKKSDLTGSLSSVTFEDFEKQPITRLDQALQGRATGIQVTQTSGTPEGGFKVRIRGANSLSGSNAPLYVVDGIVVSSISSINPNDIQSMEVLKDASATAIYGSRGANGVVLVTSKDGKRGETRISFDAYTGVRTVSRKVNLMTPSEFAEGVNFSTGTEMYSEQEIAALRAGGGTDWQDEIFQNALFSNYQISMDGGTEKMDFYISGEVFNNEGVVINKDYKRYSIRAKLNADLTERVRIGFNASGSKQETIGVIANVHRSITWDPTTPVYNDNGEFNFSPEKGLVGNGSPNPLVQPMMGIQDNYDNRVAANGYLNFEIIDNLTLNISGGIDRINSNDNSYEPIQISTVGEAEVVNSERTRLQNTNRLTYVYDKLANHRIQVDAIHEQHLYTYVSTTAYAEGFFSDNTTYKKLSLGSIQRTTNYSSDESLQSFLGRINYSFMGKYLFTATFRADGSSKFREENRWGTFPSGSVGWRISEEGFMKSIEDINNLKLRASYGITGSQAISALATRSQPRTGTSYNYFYTGGASTIGLAPSNRLANTELTWEETKQGNIGIDLGLWDSKVTFTADIYKKHTYNLLMNRSLPKFIGTTLVTENVGEVENKGIEFSIGYTPIKTNDLTIRSNFTFNRNLNKVLALVTDEPIELGSGGVGGLSANYTRVEVGQPISIFRGFIFEGVYQLGEEAEAAIYGKVPGQAKYKDLNTDGKLTIDDLTNIGDGNPDFTIGWNTTIEWKGFDMNLLFTGSYGNDIYAISRAQMFNLGSGYYSSIHADYNNRWTPENPSDIPATNKNQKMLSTQFLEDGSYIALKNVSVGYTFKSNNAFEKIRLDLLRIYGSIENAYFLTKYTGYDPESTRFSNDVDLGIDHNSYPLPRSFTFGVKLTF